MPPRPVIIGSAASPILVVSRPAAAEARPASDTDADRQAAIETMAAERQRLMIEGLQVKTVDISLLSDGADEAEERGQPGPPLREALGAYRDVR